MKDRVQREWNGMHEGQACQPLSGTHDLYAFDFICPLSFMIGRHTHPDLHGACKPTLRAAAHPSTSAWCMRANLERRHHVGPRRVHQGGGRAEADFSAGRWSSDNMRRRADAGPERDRRRGREGLVPRGRAVAAVEAHAAPGTAQHSRSTLGDGLHVHCEAGSRTQKAAEQRMVAVAWKIDRVRPRAALAPGIPELQYYGR
jgi:hypothetical protein